MRLHEFMSEHRQEILDSCLGQISDARNADDLPAHVAQFFDEMLRAIRRDQGVRESESPLPGKSESAERIGADRQRAGATVMGVPAIFAAISQAVASTGERYELTISAEEYKILNACLDAGIAASIENFWRRDRDEQNQALTESFGFLAHELRNAVGNANLAFKLLRSGGLDVNGHTADVLGRNLNRLETLLAQSLASVRLQAEGPPKLKAVHVATVLRDLEASALPESGRRLLLELDEHAYIAADEMLLISAISNLLNNALKFSPPKTTVLVRGHVENATVRIDVHDHCGGLKHADPERLFDPYVKRQKGNPTGTGLGLSIAKRAAEAMQGHLTVTDRPGDGCTFSLSFPAWHVSAFAR